MSIQEKLQRVVELADLSGTDWSPAGRIESEKLSIEAAPALARALLALLPALKALVDAAEMYALDDLGTLGDAVMEVRDAYEAATRELESMP